MERDEPADDAGVVATVHIHVVPHPDSIEHTANPDCVCGPKLDPDEDDVQCWRHQALDGDLAAQLPGPYEDDES